MKLEQVSAPQIEIADFQVGISTNTYGTNYYYTDMVGDGGTYYFDTLGQMFERLERDLKRKEEE